MGQLGNNRTVAGRGRRSYPRAVAAVLSVCLWLASAVQASDRLQLSDAWVRAMPPTQRMTAAYLRIHNSAGDTVSIIGVTASRGRASLHETQLEDGRSMMRAVSGQTLAAGETIALKPGGMHIMIMDLDEAPREGELLTLCLRTSVDQSCIDAPVRRSAPEAETGHHGHHMNGGEG